MKKTSTLKQIFGLLGTHAVLSVVIMLIMTGILALVDGKGALEYIVGILIILFYAYAIFSSAYGHAMQDHKSYSATTPYPYKGAVLAVGIVALIIISWIFHAIVWKVSPITDTNIPIQTIVGNLIYSFLTAPFWGFVDIKGSEANLFGQIISLIIPVIASAAGYYLGYIKLDYTIYLSKFMFEKKKK